MIDAFKNNLNAQLECIRAAGTYKRERVITSLQSARRGMICARE
ncbi:MAG TPA: hypothetical protein VKX17_22900 [Planctomycetota bacterium]|nr:hypothetical protein [Planctomycetota bacterium]